MNKEQGVSIVVYDGKSPEVAARILYDYLQAIGQSASFLDSNRYRDNKHLYPNAKVIIVGHHSLARNELLNVGELKYDKFGMKFGFKGSLCVLRTSRSELGFKDQAAFREFYNKRKPGLAQKIEETVELARKMEAAGNAGFLKMEGNELFKNMGKPNLLHFVRWWPAIAMILFPALFRENIVTALAIRKNPRKFQYHLLILEFINDGLFDFLGLADLQSSIKNMSPIDIDEIVDDQLQK